MGEVRAAARTFNRRVPSPNAVDASRGVWRFPNAIPFTPLRDNTDTSDKWPLAQPVYTPRTVDIRGRHNEARATHTRHIFSRSRAGLARGDPTFVAGGPARATRHEDDYAREVRDHGQSATSPCIPITNTPCGATLAIAGWPFEGQRFTFCNKTDHLVTRINVDTVWPGSIYSTLSFGAKARKQNRAAPLAGFG